MDYGLCVLVDNEKIRTKKKWKKKKRKKKTQTKKNVEYREAIKKR